MVVMASRVAKINVDITRIQDPVVRDSLRSVIDYVNDLVGKAGLTTEGLVKANTFANKDRFSVDAVGRLSCQTLGTHGEGGWKISQREGSLTFGGAAGVSLIVPGRIFGVLGWSTFNGDAARWVPMRIGSTPNANYFDVGVMSMSSQTRVINSDINDANQYRVTIFYKD
jgi:hypothetical protein